MTALSSLDFTIERRAGIDVVVFANDSCRPAMETELAMWNRLASSTKPITHVVIADTEEFGTVACGYSGSSDEIARAVMAKACAQGYSGTYQDRLAELGWRVEPVYLAVPPEVQTFQEGVSDWMAQCFVPSLYSNMTERGDRLLEEVLELLQAHGYDPSRVATLVDYVFNRPVGQPAQEVGGVMVTLAGYCWVAGLDMHAAGDTELVRITQPEVMAKIRAKQEAKNALHFDTPLPGRIAGSAAAPAAFTRMLPEVPESCERPEVGPHPFTGFDVGPFFVHLDLADNEAMTVSGTDEVGDWVVTHRESGFAVQKGIPTPWRAIWLAQSLLALSSWNGDTKDAVLATLKPSVVDQIRVLRADAMHGDCHGQIDSKRATSAEVGA